MGEAVKGEDKRSLLLLKKAREVAEVKLQDWVEDDHEATRLITEEARRSYMALRQCGPHSDEVTWYCSPVEPYRLAQPIVYQPPRKRTKG
jgi:hypothetical protein